MNKIAQEVKKMIDNGWCFECSAHLQECIKIGRCQGQKEVMTNGEESV